MQFPIHINISSKRAVYDFDINHKVTILTGYSGVGKSLMTSLIIFCLTMENNYPQNVHLTPKYLMAHLTILKYLYIQLRA